MSLFPAYSADVQEKDESKEKDDQAWLANGSFQPGESHITNDASVTKQSGSQGSPVCSDPIPDTTCVTSQVPDDSTAEQSTPRAEKHRRKHKRRRSRSRSRSPSKARHKRQKKHHRREEHRSPPPAPAELPPLKGVFLEDSGVRPESAFSVDRRPDRAARAFPEMYHHHVARYVRRLAGVLGRPRTNRRSVASAARYHDRHWRRRLRRVTSNTLPLASLPMGHSFVTLSVPAVSPPPESASDGSDYLRSVRAECPLGPPDRDTAELNRLVSERPGEASLWLRLLEARRRRLAGCVTSQQLLESQLAVLERALRHCAGSVELRLRRLELRQPDQPPEEARTEWRQLLFSHPAELGVWRRYLASQQHCPGFTVTGLISAHARCLEKMRQFQADAARPHRPPRGLEEFMLEVVGHLCRILRQAGYTERAIAIYQALLELNLFSPPLEGAAGTPASFEPFWDSRLPRVARTVSRLRRLLPELTSLAAGDRPPPTVVFVTCCLAWNQLVTAGIQEAAEVFTAVLGDLGKNRSRETDRVTADLHRACCRLLAAARPLADPLSWQHYLQRALRAALARLPLDIELTALAARHCPVPWRQRLSASADSDPPLLSLLRAVGEVAHLSPSPPPPEPPSPASPTPATVAARLRRRLARLVELPRLQHWLPLWLLYLELELRTGGKELEAVCYRAIQACPWSKQVHLYLSRTHLRRACDLMARSGLRLRLPLEELDVLLEEEPELKEEEEEEERREEGKRERESGTDSGTGTESESESELESERGEEGEDSGPGTPSPPPP
ncbi:Protein NRDE2 [Amphibalanus amphitrite]|uniref:Protein NRDE2 n=1 Tax=Amphibalanus amphitrite TaxID=1232801 RepID=A0A6A4WFE5_AMPAM|nr:Protein NRDE2 [Amphibalanus amphitrite]